MLKQLKAHHNDDFWESRKIFDGIAVSDVGQYVFAIGEGDGQGSEVEGCFCDPEIVL